MSLRTFYRIVAVGSVTLLGLLMALNVIFDVLRINPFYTMLDTWSNLALLPFFLTGAFFGIGVTVLWLGMMLDCAFASKLPVWSKALWLLLLIPTISIGALIYYFCVYRKLPSQSSLPKDDRIPTWARRLEWGG